MQIEKTEVEISTPDGQMPAFLYQPCEHGQKPAVILLMEAFGLTSHIQDVAARIANEGYVVLTPDLYYRELTNNKFGYEEVEQAMAMMYRLDFGKPIEEDIRAAIAYLKLQPYVFPEKIGVTGFCLGGGLSFLSACKFSNEIAAVASFYGMVLDDWIEAITNISVPIYLFYGGVDPFIPLERVQQIETRFQELSKEYTLKVYPDADHGFFCHERSSYNRSAAEDSWNELTQFFHRHLQKSV
ncbi:dienelactone hydrolase family protein [Trichormus variabilis ARAD]|uniref:Dienelactone hydrolase family protein n=1 Tax=Trichormus variabilis N2B TaxID=2681315 RepID=A0ABR6S773_ANAVA|nr:MULTISPECIES: dienelactone hydrolase family protein [Nostocaceae]MBC1217060.1 dienelactone hydrolase family protein [Trichormus variabilis ARAD]MBC1256558.1 dienelactone hydrolase family protein [Trichormus variabilis V5]MBC1270092.1 dienelactone hydrolase family protein [Trichormus variabilis FSR]MBC1302247.1 dienelactone hydrolase family protein [Trichormus variabilis N2B]MBC1314036.1 dienelactone hydrolase family protein [Trichormus variabilis PNB]